MSSLNSVDFCLDSGVHYTQTAGFQYLTGRMYQRVGRNEKAVSHYQNAIRLDPDNVWYHRFLGDLYHEKKMFTEALMQYREVIRIEPDNKYGRKKISDLSK